MAPSLRHPETRRTSRARDRDWRPRRKVIPIWLPVRKRLHRHPELSSAQHRTPCYGSLPKDRAGGRRTPDRRIFCAAATGADYVLLSLSVRHYGYGAPQGRGLVAGRPGPGRAALHELPAPVLTIHDVPHRMRVRHRAAPSTRPAITACMAGCGRSSRRPASPRGSSSTTSRSPRSASGWTRLPTGRHRATSAATPRSSPAGGYLH